MYPSIGALVQARILTREVLESLDNDNYPYTLLLDLRK